MKGLLFVAGICAVSGGDGPLDAEMRMENEYRSVQMCVSPVKSTRASSCASCAATAAAQRQGWNGICECGEGRLSAASAPYCECIANEDASIDRWLTRSVSWVTGTSAMSRVAGMGGANLLDNRLDTWWHINPIMNQWVTFDTGRDIELSRVRLIKRRSGGFSDAEWLGAKEGGAGNRGGHGKWRVLKSFRMPHDCMLYDVTLGPAHVRGRFWKLLILNFHPDVDKKQPDLSEIKFFGRAAVPTPAPRPTPAPTRAPTPTARRRCPCVYEDGTLRGGPELSVHRVHR